MRRSRLILVLVLLLPGPAAGCGAAAAHPGGQTFARVVLEVTSDSAHVGLELSAHDLADAGAIADGDRDGRITGSELAASRAALEAYVRERLALVQEGDSLSSAVAGVAGRRPTRGPYIDRVTIRLGARLLAPARRLGLAAPFFRDRIPGYRTFAEVRWGRAAADFEVKGAIEWIEPPAAGARRLDHSGPAPPGGG